MRGAIANGARPAVDVMKSTRLPSLSVLPCTFALLACGAVSAQAPSGDGGATRARCEQLGAVMAGRWPDASTAISSTHYFAESQKIQVPTFGGPPAEISVPAHCEIFGALQERAGALGQRFSIRFHLRLPLDWNQRFFFQGGGGTNGDIGNALGLLGAGVAPAISQGFAVVSQDSGHDNATNSDPEHGGTAAFGFDPQARANYGHASIHSVAQAAKAVVAAYYEQAASRSYFVGCSKGGEEGLAAAQRYPDDFDGIVGAAPGMSLPRAAIAQAWDVQALNGIQQVSTASAIANAFSDADLGLASRAVLAACDRDDRVVDGIVGDFQRCSGKKVHRQLSKLRCARGKTPTCLTNAQIVALVTMHAGPKDSSGRQLYSSWPWDPGLSSFAWRIWKLGAPGGGMPALNITLGGASLSAVFTTPPTPVRDAPDAQLEFVRHFDFDRDAPKIYATNSEFKVSAWDQISARSTDLSKFEVHGGKLIVPHGVSDAVFSINDTLSWFEEVDERAHGKAASFVRVFPVPGMGHCGGGPATDQFDAFGAVLKWVEKNEAPDLLMARAGPNTPWPGRQRPLCAFPAVARFRGSGSPELAESFECTR